MKTYTEDQVKEMLVEASRESDRHCGYGDPDHHAIASRILARSRVGLPVVSARERLLEAVAAELEAAARGMEDRLHLDAVGPPEHRFDAAVEAIIAVARLRSTPKPGGG